MSRPTWDETWLAVARVVSERSLCDRDRVGAVIVDSTNRIVSTAYNGPPSGYIHTRMDKPERCSQWCTRATNTPTLLDCTAEEIRGLQPDYSDCPSLHAEANALSVCDRSTREAGTIYVTSHVCSACAKLIANSGLKRVVVRPSASADHRRSDNWYTFLRHCRVLVSVM
jgi:dCMP deaminase